jgi:hypothetical protein
MQRVHAFLPTDFYIKLKALSAETKKPMGVLLAEAAQKLYGGKVAA